MRYLILSSYPKCKSQNSGDHLLTESLINLLRYVKGENIEYEVISATDDNPNDISDYNNIKAILAPAMRPTIGGYNVQPRNRNLFLEFAKSNNIPFYAIASGWGGVYPGTVKQSNRIDLDKNELTNLNEMINNHNFPGHISTRDKLTENLLLNNGIKSFGVTGDLGLFDPSKINLTFKPPKDLDHIAISLPHNKKHYDYTIKMAKKIRKVYNVKVTITLHSYKGIEDNFLKKHADVFAENNISYVNLAGGSDQLNFYDNVDIHVGFRLHAHIFFLRNRKPSILIGEDSRGIGHLNTFSTIGYDAPRLLPKFLFDILPTHFNNKYSKLINKLLIRFSKTLPPSKKYLKFLNREIENDYMQTKLVLREIDELWEAAMKPFLKQLP